jgi:imidazolonepropionase-like amidohydrolase
MEDRILVHAHSYTNDEILMLMRVAERFGFRIDAFTHVLEGFRVADELREHGAAASTFSDWWQYKLEAYDAIPYNATLMHEKGVLVAHELRPLVVPELHDLGGGEAGAVWGGLPKEDALRMMTLNPAIMLGVDRWVGSLEVGKHGDVVLLTGDPFDSFSRVEKTFIEGVLYFDSEDEEATRGEPFHALPSVPSTRHVAAADVARIGGGGTSGPPATAPELASERPALNPRAEAGGPGGRHDPSGHLGLDRGRRHGARGGRIQAMGPRGSVTIPPGARQVDVSGRHLYPGMIDPVTYLGIFEIGAIPQATDRSETGRFNPTCARSRRTSPTGVAPSWPGLAGSLRC